MVTPMCYCEVCKAEAYVEASVSLYRAQSGSEPSAMLDALCRQLSKLALTNDLSFEDLAEGLKDHYEHYESEDESNAIH